VEDVRPLLDRADAVFIGAGIVGLTEEDGWRNLRPPLVGLEDDQAAKLLARLPLSELL